MKNGCISQRKPAEFSDFSSTSKTYQRLSRNMSQCSKITLRLSTDGSTLEIEKYDIDFHSNKEELLAKNTEWQCSQENSSKQTNGIIPGHLRVLRSESAPQLTFLPSKLNTILEDDIEPERYGFRRFTNGFKPKSFRNRSKGKIKHSKTIATCTSRGESGENDLVNDQSQHVEDIESVGNAVKHNVAGASTDQETLAIFDLVSESSETNGLGRSKDSAVQSQAKIENEGDENNSKSTSNENTLVEAISQDNNTTCDVRHNSSFKARDEASTKNKSTNSNVCDIELNRNSTGHTVTSHIDLRTEVHHSINKFHEILLRRQHGIDTETHRDPADNETLVTVHATQSSQVMETNVSPVHNLTSSTDNDVSLREKIDDTVKEIHHENPSDDGLIFVKGANDQNSNSPLTQRSNENNKTKHQDEVDIKDIESECFQTVPATQLSTSENNEKESCNCLRNTPENGNLMCKSCKCEIACHRKCYCANSKGATNYSGVENEKLQSESNKIIHGANDLQTDTIKEEQDSIATLTVCRDQNSQKCDRNSVKNRTILVGISEKNVDRQESCEQSCELTTVATDRPINIDGAVLANKLDEETTNVCVTAPTMKGNVPYHI